MYQSSTKSSSFNSYIFFNINEQRKNIRETPPTCLGFERILSAISPLLIQSTIYKPQPLHSGKVPKAKKERATHRYYIPFLQLILLFVITFFTSLTKIQKKKINPKLLDNTPSKPQPISHSIYVQTRTQLSGCLSCCFACCWDQYACAVRTRSKSSWGTGSPLLC